MDHVSSGQWTLHTFDEQIHLMANSQKANEFIVS